MTSNQIAYWKNVETERHNRAEEGETRRHNLFSETESQRHNLESENLTDASRKSGLVANLIGTGGHVLGGVAAGALGLYGTLKSAASRAATAIATANDSAAAMNAYYDAYRQLP